MAAASSGAIPVYANVADAPELDRQRTVLASVPGRFRHSASKSGVVAVSGLRPGWAAQVRAAVRDGARGIFVAEPGPADHDDLQAAVEQAAGSAVPVAVGLRFAANRSWSGAVGAIRADVAASSLAESMVIVASPGRLDARAVLVNALAEQLSLVHQLGAPLTDVTVLAAAHDHYVVGAAAGGLQISFTGTVSLLADAGLSLDLIGPAQRWSAVIPCAGLAGTASISRYSRTGVQALPALYESGERAVWAQLHAALTAGRAVEASLAAVGSSIVTATRTLEEAG
jgi:hypothetical protein